MAQAGLAPGDGTAGTDAVNVDTAGNDVGNHGEKLAEVGTLTLAVLNRAAEGHAAGDRLLLVLP